MKERPILFNAEMVRAVLDGLKTQTRMLMDPQPPDFHWWAESPVEMRLASRYYPSTNGERGCPCGAVGDRLWVQESWKDCLSKYHDTGNPDDHGGPNDPCVGYRATMIYTCGKEVPPPDSFYKWHPPTLMPRWASRIDLLVTDVRIERVQDMTPMDARAEGIYPIDEEHDVLGSFIDLWDSINAQRGYSWESNPWVWCVDFERVTP